MKGKRQTSGTLLRNGKPNAVILAIDRCEDMLERLEDVEDLKALQGIRSKALTFQKLSGFLREQGTGV